MKKIAISLMLGIMLVSLVSATYEEGWDYQFNEDNISPYVYFFIQLPSELRKLLDEHPAITNYVIEDNGYSQYRYDKTNYPNFENQVREKLDNYIYAEEINTQTIIANNFVTNTTKAEDTIQKIQDFYDVLKSLSWQEVFAMTLNADFSLSNNVLFWWERKCQGYGGSYCVEGVAHGNRAMIVFIMKKIGELEERINQLEIENNQLKKWKTQNLNCWKLNTQAKIVQCMREIQ